jgi:transcriptional regulator with GAF, ATPase, and Fis domain/ABC-type uncharacterized transport system substrate-binding protein
MKMIQSQSQPGLQKSPCFNRAGLVFFFTILLIFFGFSQSFGSVPENNKKVVVFFPDRSDTFAYAHIKSGLQSALSSGTQYPIEYFFEFMDLRRNSSQAHKRLLLDLFRNRYSGKKTDLVITVSEALDFLAPHLEEIFPQIPVVCAAVTDQQIQRLNLNANFTGSTVAMDFQGQLEIALKIHPHTRHIAVVNGASKIERYLENQFRKVFKTYANRLNFIYMTGLPLSEVTEKVRNLPPQTIILFYFLNSDSAGNAYISNNVVRALSKSANAPLYGAFDAYMGYGTIGGRLLSYEMMGVGAGRMGSRLLNDTKPSDIPFVSYDAHSNMFDWRQLKRWGIGEDLLPPNSIVRFKTPSFWEQYRWYVVSAFLLILCGYSLAYFLNKQRIRLQKSQTELSKRYQFEQTLSELSARFVNLPSNRVDAQIQHELQTIGRLLEVDRVSVFQMSDNRRHLVVAYHYTDAGTKEAPLQLDFNQLAWSRKKLLAGEMISFSDIEELPAEADAEKAYLQNQGVLSAILIPLKSEDLMLGVLTLAMLSHHRKWAREQIRQFKLVAEVIANALARKGSDLELENAYNEISQLKIHLEAETAYLREEIKPEHNIDNIIGASSAIKYVLYKIEQVAGTDATVLILGETGTGKELVARSIHNTSRRRNRPLVKLNCAALSPNLIESELFGHERGAFTGAQLQRVGRFELADGTNLFLDEIGELPFELQSKLLRVLQSGEFERLGSTRTIRADVRVIAATNRDLTAEVREGKFREDLYYRLNVFPITLPPLRERKDDIPLLTRSFVDKASKKLGKSIEFISEKVMKQLVDYSWPGNVRELENVIERSVISSSGPKLRLASDLAGATATGANLPGRAKSLQEVEIDHILSVLDRTNWRIEGIYGAARILKINPSTLRSRMRKLGIQKPPNS